ncbi:hypothetical protein [Fluviispira vulneris]|uniref:hypothetical protein n=1 Tax=Fluviispira vulneris TaxID=2763012 RepID=UPI001647C878|nr:hypothetical protein [Fluviispira vulneris]
MEIEKSKINLQYVGVVWSGGLLRRDGTKIKAAAVRKLLLKLNPTLTERELSKIIYNCPSLNPNFVPDAKMMATAIKLKKMEAREKKLENERRKRLKIKKIMKEAKPDDFNLLNYLRMPMSHCIAAIRSRHDCLSETSAKMLVGRWVREGL